MHGCDIRGGAPKVAASVAGQRARSSAAIIVAEGQVEGGWGGEGQDAGRGIETRDAVPWLRRTEVARGRGGKGPLGCYEPGDGGDGATVRFSRFENMLFDSPAELTDDVFDPTRTALGEAMGVGPRRPAFEQRARESVEHARSARPPER